jgi:hypothetical protein
MFNREDDNPIDFLRGSFIVLVILGIIYLVRRQSK